MQGHSCSQCERCHTHAHSHAAVHRALVLGAKQDVETVLVHGDGDVLTPVLHVALDVGLVEGVLWGKERGKASWHKFSSQPYSCRYPPRGQS